MKCPYCGAEANGRFCSFCGSELPIQNKQGNVYNAETINQQPIIYNITKNYYVNQNVQNSPQHQLTPSRHVTQQAQIQPEMQHRVGNIKYISPKNKDTALLLCWLLGGFGAHQFYVGRWVKGILYLLTYGFFGFGCFIDFVVIASNNFKDSNGFPLVGTAIWTKRFIYLSAVFVLFLSFSLSTGDNEKTFAFIFIIVFAILFFRTLRKK